MESEELRCLKAVRAAVWNCWDHALVEATWTSLDVEGFDGAEFQEEFNYIRNTLQRALQHRKNVEEDWGAQLKKRDEWIKVLRDDFVDILERLERLEAWRARRTDMP